MLFRKAEWNGLGDGSITVAFRQWKRPTVKAGGTLRTAVGMLAIDSVEVVEPATIDAEWARRAGRPDVESLLDELGTLAADRQLYRVEFHHLGEDPRVALRQTTEFAAGELEAVMARLGRLDRAAPAPWTSAVLQVIADHPAVVSSELAQIVGMERPLFKLNVRKLKALGLTESLDVGYRISPRGQVVLRSAGGGI